jgi:HTH-type transcriptional regulator, competence development regulator
LRLLSGRSGRISIFDEWELTINSTFLYNGSSMEMNMAKTFGQRLQELRREAGISQRDLAAQTGVDFSYISKVENDRLPPPAADTVVKICAILQVPSDELLALTGKVPSDVKEMLGSSSSAQQFIRQAQEMNLSDQEWQLMTKRLKKLRA